MFLNNISSIWKDFKGEASGKRILGIICILSGVLLTISTTIVSYFKPDIPIAALAILIAPLFATGLLFWGITSYFDAKIKKSDEQ